jgi:hypothetical protein
MLLICKPPIFVQKPSGHLVSQAVTYWELSKTGTFDGPAYFRDMDDEDFYPMIGVGWPTFALRDRAFVGRTSQLPCYRPVALTMIMIMHCMQIYNAGIALRVCVSSCA